VASKGAESNSLKTLR